MKSRINSSPALRSIPSLREWETAAIGARKQTAEVRKNLPILLSNTA